MEPVPAKKNQRMARRLKAKSSSKVHATRNWLGLGPNIAIQLLDLSESGVRLLLREPMELGQEFELMLEGPGSRPKRHLARVVWCVAAQDGSYVIGAKFDKYLPYPELLSLARI
ncbi:MAG: PilZ domain-containing protein [Gemmataceae bacterium]